jgi:FkbM family methyltransferase
MYSQNNEEEIILTHFGNRIGTVLDIGANDGKTFSNSLALIEKGWNGLLIEPSPIAFQKLTNLHLSNPNVRLFNLAISNRIGKAKFYQSGKLTDNDCALVSSLKKSETVKWVESGVNYQQLDVNTLTVQVFIDTFLHANPIFNCITIDTEGFDYEILSQIDLNRYGCEVLVVEYNGIDEKKYKDYCGRYGLKAVHNNAENIIFIK